MKTRLIACFLLFLAFGVAGCRTSTTEPPVAVPSLSINHARVPLGSPVEITYEFKVSPGAVFNQDYRVFVHFVDADDELMWTDDHFPPVPTTQWKPGQTIKYNRLLFVPVYPYVGEASIEIGLYGKDNKRLPLAATEKGQHAYRMAKVQILPQTENIHVTFKDGWHQTEMAPDNANSEWHWTKREATLSFANPKRNAMFYLDLGGQPKLLAGPQTATVSIGDQVISSFTLPSARDLRRIPISAAQLGQNDHVELKLSVDRTFVPAVASAGTQSDGRELGLCVYHAFIEAQ